MPRLFTAFDLPVETYARLADLASDAIEGRWISPDQMHVTMHFIGHVNDETKARIVEAIERIQLESFGTELEKLVAFPRARSAGIVAVELAVTPQLSTTHHRLGEVLAEACGYTREARRYRPHVTLSRLKPPLDVRDFLQQSTLPASRSFHITQITVFESRLSPKGAQYERLQSYPLI